MDLTNNKDLNRSQITALQEIVGYNCEVLSESSDARFQNYAKRWTEIDRQIPAAVVLPRTEKDIQKTVRWAVDSSIPFVVKSGGCSEWSTIGTSGLVIDLTEYSAINVDAEAQTATIRGGITQKEVAVRLAEEGLFTGKENNALHLIVVKNLQNADL